MADLPGSLQACLNMGKVAFLAILVSGGIVMQILACALYNNWWPMLSVIMYVLLPMPLLFFVGSDSSSLYTESNDRKHCRPCNSETCRDHWLGGTGYGPLVVFSICDCHFVFHMDERGRRLHVVLRYWIPMVVKLCYVHQVRLLAFFILV